MQQGFSPSFQDYRFYILHMGKKPLKSSRLMSFRARAGCPSRSTSGTATDILVVSSICQAENLFPGRPPNKFFQNFFFIALRILQQSLEGDVLRGSKRMNSWLRKGDLPISF